MGIPITKRHPSNLKASGMSTQKRPKRVAKARLRAAIEQAGPVTEETTAQRPVTAETTAKTGSLHPRVKKNTSLQVLLAVRTKREALPCPLCCERKSESPKPRLPSTRTVCAGQGRRGFTELTRSHESRCRLPSPCESERIEWLARHPLPSSTPC